MTNKDLIKTSWHKPLVLLSSFLTIFKDYLYILSNLFMFQLILKFAEHPFTRAYIISYICNYKFHSYIHRTCDNTMACGKETN